MEGRERVKDKNIIAFHTANTKEDLENWLLSQNQSFINEMRKARKDNIQGKGKDWKKLKQELCIK